MATGSSLSTYKEFVIKPQCRVIGKHWRIELPLSVCAVNEYFPNTYRMESQLKEE